MDGTGGHATLKDHTGRVVREGKKASEDRVTGKSSFTGRGGYPAPMERWSVSSALQSQLPSLGRFSFSSCVCPGRLPPLDPSRGFACPLVPLWVYPMSIRGYRQSDGHFSLPSFLRAVLAGVTFSRTILCAPPFFGSNFQQVPVTIFAPFTPSGLKMPTASWGDYSSG